VTTPISNKTGIGFPGQFMFVGHIYIRLTKEYSTEKRNPTIEKISDDKKTVLGSFLKLYMCFIR
tara:strand:- start:3433 stop:3624 length:192 start_codon:yes stop_codon:yes gene_type:complete